MSTARVTVSPLRLPFTAWADAVIIERPGLPQAVSEGQWKDWAAEVARTDGTAPDPYSFGDWRSWALAWVGAQ